MRIISFSNFFLLTLDFGKERPWKKKKEMIERPKIASNISPGTPWRNGSASDSRSEGCVFESRRGHTSFFFSFFFSPSHSFYWFRIGQRYSPIFRRISPSFLQIYKTVYINIKKTCWYMRDESLITSAGRLADTLFIRFVVNFRNEVKFVFPPQ